MVLALESYQLRLPSFEGPLDLLLRLIEREQLPVSEISLLAVFDQFMEFTRDLGASSLETSAEFAVIAGRLSLLKSRALLPRPTKPFDDEDAGDLVRQLEEYQVFKQAAAALAGSLQRDEVSFERGNSAPWPSAHRLQLLPQPPLVLARAVDRWFTRKSPASVPVPAPRTISLRDMIARFVSILDRTPRLSFARLCATCSHRQEVVVAFLAVLTLLRRRMVEADQRDLFGPISVTRATVIASRMDASRAGDEY
jgi:segregation and condensation protein A